MSPGDDGEMTDAPRSPTPADDVRDRHASAFRIAWAEFAATCSDTVAPEATYQAWLAHFLMQRIGVLSVVREVDFGARHLGVGVADRLKRHHLMVDIVCLREPLVNLPRRAALTDPTLPNGSPNPRSGLARLKDFSVISELKVSSTQGEGHEYSEVIRDFVKLSAVLQAAQDNYPEAPLPVAFVAILGNHKRRFDVKHLLKRLESENVRPDIELLFADRRSSLQGTFGDIDKMRV